MSIFITRSGINQNDASKYSIVKLYVEQANEQAGGQPNEQAEEQTNEHIITKLNCLYNYIYNKGSGEKIGLIDEDREPLIGFLKKLDLYSKVARNTGIENQELEYIILNNKILCWAIKEIYLSPHRVLLVNLKIDKLKLRYLKARKYIFGDDDTKIFNENEKGLFDLINYFITCLQDELEKGRIKQC